jgi:hypothetical protein
MVFPARQMIFDVIGDLGDPRRYTEGGPNPRLMTNLPGWCLRALVID